MTIYDFLKADHNKIKNLLEQLTELSGNEENRTDLIQEIRDLLIPHARAEESVFYNSLRAAEASKDIVHSYQEHMEAEMLLRTLQLKDKMDADWRSTAAKLKEVLEHHIAEEENTLFVLAKNLFTPKEAEMMGVAFEQLKSQVATEGFLKQTLDLVANMMPPRFAKAMRGYQRQSRL